MNTAHADSYKLINIGQEFRIYIEDYKSESSEVRWEGWKVIENKYSHYLSQTICNIKEPECELKQRSKIDELFETLPIFENKMWNIFDNADQITRSQLAKFKQSFPKLGNNIQIVFTPSLLTFNARVSYIDEKPVLFIAADSIAKRNDNLNVLFSHEFFHYYQFNKLENNKNWKTFASPLWFEGFATWTSIHLNPGTSDLGALMDLDLATYCSKKSNVALLAIEYRNILEMPTDDPQAQQTYSDWFLIRGSLELKRGGYCLGLQVMREIIKSINYLELTLLNEVDFIPLIKASLNNLAK